MREICGLKTWCWIIVVLWIIYVSAVGISMVLSPKSAFLNPLIVLAIISIPLFSFGMTYIAMKFAERNKRSD